MAIFAIFRVTNPPALGAKIESLFPRDHLKLQDDEWLISSDLTAEELSDRLGLVGRESAVGSAIVFGMRSYYGRAPTNVWDWIQTKAENAFG